MVAKRCDYVDFGGVVSAAALQLEVQGEAGPEDDEMDAVLWGERKDIEDDVFLF